MIALLAAGALLVAGGSALVVLLRHEVRALRTELARMRTDLTSELEGLRSELGGMRSDLVSELGALRSDLGSELRDLGTEVGGRIDGLGGRIEWRPWRWGAERDAPEDDPEQRERPGGGGPAERRLVPELADRPAGFPQTLAARAGQSLSRILAKSKLRTSSRASE